jgi:hypothetical protein
MDVKSAFLNSEIKETVFIQQSPGFVNAEHREKVMHLHKVLYGLRQAPRAWNVKLYQSLKELGFKRCTAEHDMYTRGNGFYVDDLVITGIDFYVLTEFKDQMLKVFKMSNICPLRYYLRIEVHQSALGITNSQGAYADKVLNKAGLSDNNPCRIPTGSRLHLSKTGSRPRVDATHYCSLIGGLRYLVYTRPDLAYSVGYKSRFMQDPWEDHLMAEKYIFITSSAQSTGVLHTLPVRRRLRQL